MVDGKNPRGPTKQPVQEDNGNRYVSRNYLQKVYGSQGSSATPEDGNESNFQDDENNSRGREQDNNEGNEDDASVTSSSGV